jgi:hypothetical protein
VPRPGLIFEIGTDTSTPSPRYGGRVEPFGSARACSLLLCIAVVC